jgi:L-threonylcarbamoyladenylate synthase
VPQVYDANDTAGRAAAIAAGTQALRAGELVAVPTETVYGLAADAGDARAVAAIFLAKGRPRFNPLIVHVASLEAASAIAVLAGDAERLARAFWPGPLTLVVEKRREAGIADLVTAGLDTIAVRVPSHPVAHDLLATFGGPLAAPSANLSGHVSATTAAHVVADFDDQVSVVLDAGPTPIGMESTIVGLADGQATLLRPGAVARADIETVLGRPLTAPMIDAGAPVAPGMLMSHYAPAATVRLNAKDVGPGEALLAFGPDLPAGADRAAAVFNLSPSGDLTEAAANFFAGLRNLDRQVEAIAVVPIPAEGLGEAINDRLRRAAAPRG